MYKWRQTWRGERACSTDRSSSDTSDSNSGQCHVASAHVHGPEDGPATTQIGEFDDLGLNVVTKGKGKGKPFSGHGH